MNAVFKGVEGFVRSVGDLDELGGGFDPGVAVPLLSGAVGLAVGCCRIRERWRCVVRGFVQLPFELFKLALGWRKSLRLDVL